MTQEIALNLFDLIEGSVLELGPHDGSWFTAHLVQRSSNLAVIELDGVALAELKRNYPQVRPYLADYHTAIQGLGSYDNVVLFGVLSHTPNPLGLLEDIVHYIKPRQIFIEAEPGGSVRCVREGINQPGQRQSRRPTCGLSIQLGSKVYADAMANLGYVPVKSYVAPQGHKQGLEYTAYALHNSTQRYSAL